MACESPMAAESPIACKMMTFNAQLSSRIAVNKAAMKRRKKTTINHSALRSKIAHKFVSILDDDDRGNALERYVHRWAVQACYERGEGGEWDNPTLLRKYSTKVRDIVFNLTNPDNPSFVNAVLSRDISVKKIPSMTHHEMYPELREHIFYKIEQREIRNLMRDQELCDGSGLFKCPRCRTNNTTYYSLQTRSADEPMTNFVTCLGCENRWKD